MAKNFQFFGSFLVFLESCIGGMTETCNIWLFGQNRTEQVKEAKCVEILRKISSFNFFLVFWFFWRDVSDGWQKLATSDSLANLRHSITESCKKARARAESCYRKYQRNCQFLYTNTRTATGMDGTLPHCSFENLKPVEITKNLFQHHLNILKNV